MGASEEFSAELYSSDDLLIGSSSESNPTHIGRCLSDNPSYRPAISDFLVDLSTGPNRTATGPVPVSVWPSPERASARAQPTFLISSDGPIPGRASEDD